MPPPPSICVFGEALVDEFADGPVIGGAPFNVARHLAALGNHPLMITAIGRDAHGARIEAEFRRFGLANHGLQIIDGARTGVVRVQVQPDRSHEFIIEHDCAYDRIAPPPRDLLDPDGYLYYGTLALRSDLSHDTWQQLLRHHRGLRFFDLNWREGHVGIGRVLEALAQADIAKVNEEELELLLSWSRIDQPMLAQGWDKDSAQPAVQALMQEHLLSRLVVTRGARGYVVFDAKGRCTHANPCARPVRLVDTVGAGDAFSAIVLHGLHRGWDFATTLERASHFASCVCEIAGAVPQDLDVYQTWAVDWQ